MIHSLEVPGPVRELAARLAGRPARPFALPMRSVGRRSGAVMRPGWPSPSPCAAGPSPSAT